MWSCAFRDAVVDRRKLAEALPRFSRCSWGSIRQRHYKIEQQLNILHCDREVVTHDTQYFAPRVEPLFTTVEKEATKVKLVFLCLLLSPCSLPSLSNSSFNESPQTLDGISTDSVWGQKLPLMTNSSVFVLVFQFFLHIEFVRPDNTTREA